MFEGFSKEARAAVIAAQSVARDAGARAVDTRHVAIALLRTSAPARAGVAAAGGDPATVADHLFAGLRAETLDADALGSLGIDLDEVRRRADEVFGDGALDRVGSRAHQPVGRDAKKALELALRGTVRLGAKGIDGGELLMGILRADCPGRAALEAAGVDLVRLRAALEVPYAA